MEGYYHAIGRWIKMSKNLPIKTIDEMAKEAGTPDTEDHGTGYMMGPYTVNEKVWGLKNGVYAPVGEIKLPVQVHMYEQKGKREVASATEFSLRFFEGQGIYTDEPGAATALELDGPGMDYEELEAAAEGRDTRYTRVIDFGNPDIAGQITSALSDRKLVAFGIGYRDIGLEDAIREHIGCFFRIYNAIARMPGPDCSTGLMSPMRKALECCFRES